MFQYNSSVIQDDLDNITKNNVALEKFKNATVLITGINGMLATNLAFLFFYLNDKFSYNIKIIGLGRNQTEFKKRFFDSLNKLDFIEQDINDEIHIDGDVDYIFHAATNASPESMITHPVSIALTNSLGTINVANFALEKKAHVHFLSTREVYGSNKQETLVESDDSHINSMDIRNVYPISKLSAESILLAFKNEFNLSISISRIAHAYGPGMKVKNDGRVMADFIGHVLEQKNIILQSDGSAERAFIYVSDAISGIINSVLNHSESNFVFNLSNETEPITVKELAYLIRSIGNEFSLSSEVIASQHPIIAAGYSKNERVPLNTGNLEKIGWRPVVDLKSGIRKTLKVYLE